jgi:hypothetical protein
MALQLLALHDPRLIGPNQPLGLRMCNAGVLRWPEVGCLAEAHT